MIRQSGLACAVAALLLGCTSASSTTSGGPLPSGGWIARISPTINAFGVQGDVRLVPVKGRPDQYEAVFDMRSLRDRARHPWVIRTGLCDEINARELTSRAVPVIEAALDRTARLKTAINVRLTPGYSYHVVIAAATGDPDLFVACGPLVSVP